MLKVVLMVTFTVNLVLFMAYAKHCFGVNWDYHHNVGLINCTSFLLNYMSDILDGAHEYGDWINGDLYEKMTERFGICTFPESRHYFFSKIRVFTGLAGSNGKGKINYEAFAQEWNQSASGKDCFYVTTDVLSVYAKSWEKITNIQASQEIISHQMETIHKTSTIFAAIHQSFPNFLTDTPTSVQPSQGLIDLDHDSLVPPSLSVDLPISLPHVPIPYIPPSPPHPLVPPPSEDQSDTPSMPPVLPLIFVPSHALKVRILCV
ncbi:hypothetical protein L208DRAFT_1380566 [Tricholoma matsutake]|nr:hypothetical protein L208DRAFT_1380566 [Tricholoma matsutake 945]